MTRQRLTEYDIPTAPGVYFFKHGNEVLYVGKATVLKTRVASYFTDDVFVSRGKHIEDMVLLADNLEWLETGSVIEALMLETKLIKELQPKFNTRERDDKSFNCIVITKEPFPRVLLVREKEFTGADKLEVTLPEGNMPVAKWFGPFVDATELKTALKIIRKVLPFRDNCAPLCGKSCFENQIGLCPGVCSGEMKEDEYREQIRQLSEVFSGKTRALVRELRTQMDVFSKEGKFEQAAATRDKIFALEHLNETAMTRRDINERIRHKRVEAYDVSHTAGTEAVGTMVAVSGDRLLPKETRYFKLSSGANDAVNLKEMLGRRFTHFEWEYPKLIVVDGGKAQQNAAAAVLSEFGIQIPIVGVIKNEKHNARKIDWNGIKDRDLETSVLLANAAVHKSVLLFHRKRRSKSSLLI